jgi:xanthine/uracil permease
VPCAVWTIIIIIAAVENIPSCISQEEQPDAKYVQEIAYCLLSINVLLYAVSVSIALLDRLFPPLVSVERMMRRTGTKYRLAIILYR